MNSAVPLKDTWNNLFGDEEDSELQPSPSSPSSFTFICNCLFVNLMRLRPVATRQASCARHSDGMLSLPTEVVIINQRTDEAAAVDAAVDNLKERLETAGFLVRCTLNSKENSDANLERQEVDVLLDLAGRLEEDTNSLQARLEQHSLDLLPSGHLLVVLESTVASSENLGTIFSHSTWVHNSTTYEVLSEHLTLVCIQKRAVMSNTQSAIWRTANAAALEREQELLEEITVVMSMAERKNACASVWSHKRAAQSLIRNGLCILRGLFAKDSVQYWGECARSDLQDALDRLLQLGVDLLHPDQGSDPLNYLELAMREDFRCDLRFGKRTKTAASEQMHQHGANALNPRNQVVLDILQAVMNPDGGEDAAGNWGRWNFKDGGPSAPKILKNSSIGAVMSLPGAADQAVHADTAHLYEHMHLPPHYVNMFIPAVENVTDLSVGQTAFVVGSHFLKCSARLMTKPGGREQLETLLVRPHLESGDVILFDTRILHFGLANRSVSTRRAMLYVNYLQPWFEDKKNWNKASLFE